MTGRPTRSTIVLATALIAAGCIAAPVPPEDAGAAADGPAPRGAAGFLGRWTEALDGEGAAIATAPSLRAPTVHRAGAFLDLEAADVLGATPVVVERLLGTRGGEPSIGITSSGAAFVVSGDRAMRSRDLGLTWEEVYDFGTYSAGGVSVDAHGNNDPYLWVDPVTDRIFMPSMWPVLTCSDAAWSDDDGATWTARPMACGLPVVDHQKLATGPYVAGAGLNPVYPNVVYYCYNKLLNSNCAVSHDGGVTFPFDTVAIRACGGINGVPASAPDGTVYLPAGESCGQPVIGVSTTNGLVWTSRYLLPVGPGSLGNEEIDPDVTVTPDGTAYYVWRARLDHRIYMLRSTDRFETVEGPFLVSPPDVTSTNYVAVTSGDDGRLAIAFLGTRDTDANAGQAPPETRWHMFMAFSFDAASADPTFVVAQATPDEDPVQVGHIWQSGGGDPARNMLDFIDLHRGPDGRPWVAFTDGCTVECAGNPLAEPGDSRRSDTAVAVMIEGPSLLAAVGTLGGS